MGTVSVASIAAPVSLENTPPAAASVPRISGMPRSTTCRSMMENASSLGTVGWRFWAVEEATNTLARNNRSRTRYRTGVEAERERGRVMAHKGRRCHDLRQTDTGAVRSDASKVKLLCRCE